MRAGGCSLAASRKVGGPRSPRSFLQPPAASMRVGLPIPSPRSAGRPLNRIASRLQRAVTYRILSYRIVFYSILSAASDGPSIEASNGALSVCSLSLRLSLSPSPRVGRRNVASRALYQAGIGRRCACASLHPVGKSQEVAGGASLARGGAIPGAQASRGAPAGRILRTLSPLHTGTWTNRCLVERRPPKGALRSELPRGTHASKQEEMQIPVSERARRVARGRLETSRAKRVANLFWACA